MSHSKRNTSLAYFTAHERSQLRSTWGSQSTRLTRESFLPFGFCRLCLGYAREPVTCSGENGAEEVRNGEGESENGKVKEAAMVHLFCRECALNDLMAQRKEIKRLEKEAESRGRDEADGRARDEEDRRRRDLERFERNELGFSDSDVPTAKKRKRTAEEIHSRHADNSSKDHQDAAKKAKTSESSFWTPGSESTTTSTSLASTTSAAAKAKQQHKLHPLCPASTPHTKHAYSLKSLVPVTFTTTQDESDPVGADEPSRICPSCKKALTNTSRAMLGTAEGCGHVICGTCAELSTKGSVSKNGVSSTSNSYSADANPRCFVCEADLSGKNIVPEAEDKTTGEGEKAQSKKHKHKDSTRSKSSRAGRLVEISCEGTGFAGGGANMAKREGVVFQC